MTLPQRLVTDIGDAYTLGSAEDNLLFIDIVFSTDTENGQYSSASMMVSTRAVTVGSAASGECMVKSKS